MFRIDPADIHLVDVSVTPSRVEVRAAFVTPATRHLFTRWRRINDEIRISLWGSPLLGRPSLEITHDLDSNGVKALILQGVAHSPDRVLWRPTEHP